MWAYRSRNRLSTGSLRYGYGLLYCSGRQRPKTITNENMDETDSEEDFTETDQPDMSGASDEGDANDPSRDR